MTAVRGLWFAAPAIGVLIFLVPLVIAAPILGTQFGAIDDHEIAWFAGQPWPDVLLSHLVEPNRVRPGWWLFHVSEMAVWGMNPAGYYLDRFLLFVATMGCALAVAVRFAPAWLAVLASLLVVAGPQADNWLRLGTQEAVAVPLLLGGVALIVRGKGTGLVLLVLAAMTKESMVPFAAVGLVLAWQYIDRRAVLVAGVAVTVDAALIAWITMTAPPLYHQDRTRLLETAWWMIAGAPSAIAVLAILAGWRPPLGWVLLGLCLVAAQTFLYAGLHAPRYLVPGTLVPVAAAIAGLVWLHRRSVPAAVILAALLAASTVPAMRDLRERASDRQQASVQWQTGIAELRAVVAAHPGVPVDVDLRNPADIEVPLALSRYVEATYGTGTPCIGVGFDLEPRRCAWRVTIYGAPVRPG